MSQATKQSSQNHTRQQSPLRRSEMRRTRRASKLHKRALRINPTLWIDFARAIPAVRYAVEQDKAACLLYRLPVDACASLPVHRCLIPSSC